MRAPVHSHRPSLFPSHVQASTGFVQAPTTPFRHTVGGSKKHVTQHAADAARLGIFLVHHLYRYDRFKCLKWGHSHQSGAFKRIMTYTYLITIPLIAIYSIGFAAIKYDMGYAVVPGFGIQPVPWQDWPKKYQHAIFPLYLVFSVGWSLELVTHLEELCFWLFLLNAGRAGQDWFRSGYFKIWIVGSGASIIYMPLVTIFTRSDPLKNEAYTFLAGSFGSLCITVWFTPILWTFPKFIENLRSDGVEMNTLMRLVKFHELNTIRIALRFVFCVSLIILGVDGARPHQHINDKFIWTELLSMLAGVGVTVSSAITLVIFFPRNIYNEYSLKQASLQSRSLHLRSRAGAAPHMDSYASPRSVLHIDDTDAHERARSELSFSLSLESPLKASSELRDYVPPVMFAPNRRLETGVTVQGMVAAMTPSALAMRHDDLEAGVHPFAQHYTSPIDLVQGENASWNSHVRGR
ncbi:uncharacterized protein PHACADRAFT_260202 [Phanerochaete carnosa HHB-10118-sp]|uniref:Uncharacterized protein n=1 Tax=Phanerochaete carnosa (strain HHB-10118-sp) TaxID=650164 RepID=K5W3K8_PHACS|nr:uncharacterized protein PHACADRAFT_260202 [Phanerochaete carnosa HHB-10118-sp]EKM53715.1 hypothetical protein PHACADRAFT_260202 [Phanerochaete carnosa HHB-10118-sp]